MTIFNDPGCSYSSGLFVPPYEDSDRLEICVAAGDQTPGNGLIGAGTATMVS